MLPETVADTVATRLDRMTDDERSVIESAALLGRAFDFDVLNEMYDAATAPALERASALGLLHENPDQPGQLGTGVAGSPSRVAASAWPSSASHDR